MRYFVLFVLLCMSFGMLKSQTVTYENYFHEKALRIDYIHTGNSIDSQVGLLRFVEDRYWAGNPNILIDPFGYGKYRVNVYSMPDKKLIFSYGYCTLFEEWQTTAEARNTSKSFEESIVIPFPKNSVEIELLSLDKNNKLQHVFSFRFDADTEVETVDASAIPVRQFVNSGNAASCLDIAVVAEGYTLNEMSQFESHAEYLIGYLFSERALMPMRDKVNIYFVMPPSKQSGTDVPGEDIWLNTALNSRFYTFGSDRYLTTASYHRLRDAVSTVPTDQIIVLVNSEKYGGGGIYNFYSISSSKNIHSGKVLIHEFGHAFAALGDEYYTSETSYNDFYSLEHEPYQPNLTTLVDFESKWKDMVHDSVPIPTPETAGYLKTVGVFEGAGYVEKGIYRSRQHCRMKELNSPFCEVCARALMDMFKFYTGAE